jgi:alkylated DNA repair dioxygenase AlkB
VSNLKIKMNLFTEEFPKTIIEREGKVLYYGKIFTSIESDEFFKSLSTEINWIQDKVILYGKEIITKRKVAWFGDKPYPYKYSGSIKIASPWTSSLKLIKQKIEIVLNKTFNSCLCNHYLTGEEGMSWHSDDEKTLEKNGCIASISLGAERPFDFKHNTTLERTRIFLETGSLLTMEGEIQSNYKHCLPIQKKVKHSRINLTFRNFVDGID